MSAFQEREKGFEAKFAHDEELKFKALARRDYHIGRWASEKLGLVGVAAEAYARGVVSCDLDRPDEDSVFRKIRSDFDAKDIGQSDHEIRQVMDNFLAQALAELKAGI
jgi:hypothetical protein